MAETLTQVFTWQTASKTAEVAIQTFAAEIPGIGGLLSNVVSAFWPSISQPGLDAMVVWDAIRDDVNALVNNAISQENYNLVTQNLDTFPRLIGQYQDLCDGVTNTTPGEPTDINSAFISVNDLLAEAISQAQMKGQEWNLLPLFVPLVHLQLALVRDVLSRTKSDSNFYDTYSAQLNGLTTLHTQNQGIPQYMQYAVDTYLTHLTSGTSPVSMPGWIAANTQFVENMMSLVQQWSLLATQSFTIPQVPSQVFLGPVGNQYSQNYYYPAGFKSLDLNLQGPITQVHAWYTGPGGRLRGLRLTYGSTIGPRMASDMYHTNRNLFEWYWEEAFVVTPDNPIVGVFGHAGDIVDSVGFILKDGTRKGPYGNTEQTFEISLADTDPKTNVSVPRILSSIVVQQDIADGYQQNGEGFDVSGMIFGFRKADSYPATPTPLAPGLLEMGQHVGTVTNTTKGQTGTCTLNITIQGTTIQGMLLLDGLGGGGAFTGVFDPVAGSIAFNTKSDDGTQITWSAQLVGSTLQGDYVTYYPGSSQNYPDNEYGTWQVSVRLLDMLVGTYEGHIETFNAQTIPLSAQVTTQGNAFITIVLTSPQLGTQTCSGYFDGQKVPFSFMGMGGMWEGQLQPGFLSTTGSLYNTGSNAAFGPFQGSATK